MLRIRTIFFGLAALAVTACGPFDAVTRSAPYENLMPLATPVAQPAPQVTEVPEIVTRAAPEFTSPTTPPKLIPFVPQTSFKVVAIDVEVPHDLKVSESNALIPLGDIVWREDASGDRYKQVQAILQTAVEKGVEHLNGDREVILRLVVTRFHALTKRARYSVGGLHNIKFNLSIYDAATGQQIGETKKVDASFEGYGGQQAIQSELAGITQKVRIIDHVASVIEEELTNQAKATLVASLNQ